jgi:DnaJ-class molecular chaperone
MRTITVTVRIVPCPDCNGSGYYLVNVPEEGNREAKRDCPKCREGHGEVVATSERLLVGRVLVWDRFR